MSFVIETRFQQLERLVIAASDKNLDPVTQSYFCKLGSVLICGNVERCVEIVLTEKLAAKSGPEMLKFLTSYFKRGVNYDCEEILNLLYKFDKGWGDNFRAFMDGNARIKESISSCYAVRNSVAHGGGQSLGFKVLRQYYDDTFTLVVEMQALLK